MFATFISEPQSLHLPGFNGLVTQCEFSVDHFSDVMFETLGIRLPEQLRTAVDKRKAEFLAGRYLAKMVLFQASIPQLEVGIGDNREPIWPRDIIGSISHHSNKVVCAIHRGNGEREGIGIDIEQVIPEDMIESMYSAIVCPRERALLADLPGSQRLWLTVVFSAKESLFKALYGQVRRYFDFTDAEVIKVGQQSLKLRLVSNLTPQLCAGLSFDVDFQVRKAEVLTFVKVLEDSKLKELATC